MSEKWEYRPGTLVPGTKYQVVQKLGAGGMGTVYEVEDVSVERRFVLKTIHVKYAGHQVAVDRFVREAKALGKLEHKNIVQVVTAGVTGDALQLRYFVMEKLTGHSLRTVIDQKGGLPLDAACRFMIELMSALNCAHDAGIVHRDIKPENIFIAKDSVGVTNLKLLDFGIMTSTGTRTVDRKGFMGTARYSSPEQMSETHEATPRSDLYSASLVFYELVCGIGPFDDLEEIPELMEAHRSKTPPSPAKFRRGIPASLEALILRGLAKNPDDRQPDAFSYAEDVSRILQELRTTRAADPGPTPRPTANAARAATTQDATDVVRAADTIPMIAPSETPAPKSQPIISMTDIDQQAAQDFARVSRPGSGQRGDEPGTMGATHSTMPGLPASPFGLKNRAWIFVGVSLAVLVAAFFIRPLVRSSIAAKIPSASPPPISQPAPPSASTILQPETAPIVNAPPMSASAAAIDSAAAAKSSSPKTSHAPPTSASASSHAKLPGSGL
jgi:serine/threonine protein kinase